MAELAYAYASGAYGLKPLGVQLPLSAPIIPVSLGRFVIEREHNWKGKDNKSFKVMNTGNIIKGYTSRFKISSHHLD